MKQGKKKQIYKKDEHSWKLKVGEATEHGPGYFQHFSQDWSMGEPVII